MKISSRIVGSCLLLSSVALAGCAADLNSDSQGKDPGDVSETPGSTGSDDTGSKAPSTAKAVAGRHIVRFRDGWEGSLVPARLMTNSQRAALNTRNRQLIEQRGGRVIHTLGRINAVAAELTADQVSDLQKSGLVDFVERDPQRSLIMPKGASQASIGTLAESVPYGITMVQAPQVSDANAGNRKICITDTGYDGTHEDLRKAPGANIDGVANDGNGHDNGNWYHDGFGHGTHVAGTISGLGGNGKGVVGVNPSNKVGLYIVKVFTDDSNASWNYGSDMIAAIEQCVNAGANVISSSLGGSESSAAEEQAFNDAYAAGVLPIAAAGNDGTTGLSYPASYAAVVSVAAIDSSKKVASFSQKNSEVEIAAPGVGVLSTLPGNKYEAWDGTSMATPHVSGVAALVWSNFPSCTNVQIRNALNASAQDLGSSGRDNSYGYGLVQAKAAVDYLTANGCGGNPPPPPPPPPPTGGELTNGVAQGNLSAATNADLGFFIKVPSGASNLTFTISGGSGDADLYTKFGSAPTLTSYDCRPYLNGNSEKCTVAAPQAGTYYVNLHGYAAFSGVSLVASFSTSGGGTCTAGSFAATDVPQAIPDNNATGIKSTIAVNTNGKVGTLKVSLGITHTYRGDLVVTLISPSGAQYVLSNRAGGSADNLNISAQTVTAAAGQTAAGNWQLAVQDRDAQDTGTLNSFSLDITPTCN